MLIFHFTDRDGYRWVVPEHALLSIRSGPNPNVCEIVIAPSRTFFVKESLEDVIKRIF